MSSKRKRMVKEESLGNNRKRLKQLDRALKREQAVQEKDSKTGETKIKLPREKIKEEKTINISSRI